MPGNIRGSLPRHQKKPQPLTKRLFNQGFWPEKKQVLSFTSAEEVEAPTQKKLFRLTLNLIPNEK